MVERNKAEKESGSMRTGAGGHRGPRRPAWGQEVASLLLWAPQRKLIPGSGGANVAVRGHANQQRPLEVTQGAESAHSVWGLWLLLYLRAVMW